MHEIAAWLGGRHDAMVALLARLVDQDSGSYDKAGVDRVGDILAEFLLPHGVTCERLSLEHRGDGLRASLPGPSGGRPALLLGHRDTVFPAGEAGARPFRVEGGRGHGPGAADMKAGLVTHAFVMAGFAALGAPLPLVALFTGDEEIGSQGSRPLIQREAAAARCVFNAEPGRVSGNVVTGRRGGLFFRCDVAGRAAHAGLDFERGRSAILAIARKIEAWMALPERFPGTTANVGTVSGGQSVNTVAPHATCDIDLRYGWAAERDALVEAVRDIAERPSLADTVGTVRILGEFEPMEGSPGSEALFDAYVAAARSVGLDVGAEFTRSCADSGLTAAMGVPTLCGVGPVGGGAHSPEEYVELSTLVPRAQALALALAGLPPDA